MQVVRSSKIAATYFLLFFSMQNSASEQEQFWTVFQASSSDERTAIASAGISIEEIGDDWVAGIADCKCIAELSTAGFLIQKMMSLSDYYQEQVSDLSFTRSSYRFTRYNEMVKMLESLARENDDFVSLISFGKSFEGRDLLALHFGKPLADDSAAKERPGILFVGNHHAREHLSAEICLSFARYLCEHCKTSAIAPLLESLDIYIVPMVNPDGVAYDFSKNPYAYWRKNRSINADHSVGVDLNRNYDYYWSGPGKSDRPASETYGGPYPFSEPETKAIKTFIETHKGIKVLVSYHSYGKLILYPWGCKKNAIEDVRDRAVYDKIAQAMGAITGYKVMQAAAQYVAPGDAVDWAYGVNKIFSFTVELMPTMNSHEGGFYPAEAHAIQDDIEKNIQAGLYLCSICADPYRLID